jgi:hypothetical protein
MQHELVTGLFDQHVPDAQHLFLGAAVEGQHHRDVLLLPVPAGKVSDRGVGQTYQGARPLMSLTVWCSLTPAAIGQA